MTNPGGAGGQMSIPGIMNANPGLNTISSGRPADNRQMSLLPVVNQPWPPPEYNPVSYMMRLWDAWWTGDRQKLAWVYYNLGANSPIGRSFFSTTGEVGLPTPRPGQYRGGLLGSIEYSFWGQPVPPGEKRSRSHVPIAGDIASTSASLLFSKPPVLKSSFPEGSSQAKLNNAWFENLIDDAMHKRLLEAAEMCAALGGVFLRVVWDRSVADQPWIVAVPADVAVPHFSYDKLQNVTFWQVLEDMGDTVIRHLEMHAPGANSIEHGLYVGDQTDLGDRVPLDNHLYTRVIQQGAPNMIGDTIYFPDQPLEASSVVYVPNMTPNRIWRDLGAQAWPLGRSDYTAVENLMDNLDEVYSSWMRDVRHAKSRLIVPPDYIDNIGRGKGGVFDLERQVYTPMDMLHDGSNPSQTIIANQFAIRWQEHQQTCQELINKIVQEAGYSPQTFGDYAGQAPTATEITARERLSMMTRGKKINYWRPALQDIIYGLMTIESIYFGNKAITPERPDIDFVESISPDMQVLAQTANLLDTANAASRETLVQLVHPDWTSEEVRREVTTILEETGLVIAGRARVALTPEPGESITDDISELVAPIPTPPVPLPPTSETGDEGATL